MYAICKFFFHILYQTDKEELKFNCNRIRISTNPFHFNQFELKVTFSQRFSSNSGLCCHHTFISNANIGPSTIYTPTECADELSTNNKMNHNHDHLSHTLFASLATHLSHSAHDQTI